LKAVVLKALAKDAKARQQSMAELRHELRTAAERLATSKL
jgi:hypothetical protein